tara:strand:- start:34 stop:219 length:186 start_codon:yes stop_codon:yes gene_type:complete
MAKLQNSYLVDNDESDYWLNLEEKWDMAVLNKINEWQNLSEDEALKIHKEESKCEIIWTTN